MFATRAKVGPFQQATTSLDSSKVKPQQQTWNGNGYNCNNSGHDQQFSTTLAVKVNFSYRLLKFKVIVPFSLRNWNENILANQIQLESVLFQQNFCYVWLFQFRGIAERQLKLEVCKQEVSKQGIVTLKKEPSILIGNGALLLYWNPKRIKKRALFWRLRCPV